MLQPPIFQGQCWPHQPTDLERQLLGRYKMERSMLCREDEDQSDWWHCMRLRCIPYILEDNIALPLSVDHIPELEGSE